MNECGTYAPRTCLAAEPKGLATSWDPPTDFAKLANSPNWLKNPHRLWLENKIRVRCRLCGSECCSSNSNALDISQKGLTGIQSHHSRGKMSKKAREKPAEAGSASVSPYGSVLSYEQVTSQPNRLINLIWSECRTWFIGPCDHRDEDRLRHQRMRGDGPGVAVHHSGATCISVFRCMTARDRLRAWDIIFFGSSNLTHKSCGIFVASWGFAHCIGTRLVFHNFFDLTVRRTNGTMQKTHEVLKIRLIIFTLAAFIRWSLEPQRLLIQIWRSSITDACKQSDKS